MDKKVKQDRIKVLARIRPLNQKEIDRNDQRVIETSNGQCIQFENVGSLLPRKFQLDAVLEENNTQEEVFENIIPLLESYIDGYNCTVFTYGQTGTGKTFTMLGYDIWEMASTSNNSEKAITDIARDEAYMGVVPRSMKWLLSTLNNLQLTYTISISYVELYNDIKILDLLDMNEISKQSLDIRENKRGEIIVPGLTCIQVTTIDQILKLLWDGAKCRSIAATDMNDHSSRSHTIFIVYLQIITINSNTGTKEIKNSKLCLVDLAGSEKWKSHQMATFSETRIKELTSINRSLSALGNCISALLKPSRGHVPYRDSKLTRLLQDSLGGNTKTLFIVTISPSWSSLEETTSTLQFADRAMKVQVLATSNTITTPSSSATMVGNSQYYEIEIQKYQHEITRLKSLLQNILQKTSENKQKYQNYTKVENDEEGEGEGEGEEETLPRLAREIQRIDLNPTNDENDPFNSADEGGRGGGEYFDFHASLSQELIDLKEENMKLIQELYQSQEEVKNLQEEKRMILSAIYEDQDFSLEREYAIDSDNQTMVTGIKLMYQGDEESEEGGEGGRVEGVSTRVEDKRNSLSKIQQRIVSLQQEELERRKEVLEETDAIQEDRWKWLQQYHSWLQTQSNPTMNSSMKIDEQLYHRVCLMEASILLQADELQRTKKLFLQTNKSLQEDLKEATNELDQMYAEKGAHLERIQFLEDEIHKLLSESEQSLEHENKSPIKRYFPSPGTNRQDRPSYIPIRMKSKSKSSAQIRLQYALNSKPPEPPGAPPRKPPEPSMPPPPPGILRTVVRSTLEKQTDQEVDVFSNQFSPQKFLNSLRITHLGEDLDLLPQSPASASSQSSSFSTSSQSTSMTSSKMKSYLQSKLNTTVSPAEGSFSSPFASSSSEINTINNEWQAAEIQRVETRRKIVSPSSAFLPVQENNNKSQKKSSPRQLNEKIDKKKKIMNVNSSSREEKRPLVHSKLTNGDTKKTNFPSTTTSSSSSSSSSLLSSTSSSMDFSVDKVDIQAALSMANKIIEKHQTIPEKNMKIFESSRSYEEHEQEHEHEHEHEQEEDFPSSAAVDVPAVVPLAGTGRKDSVWMMIQDPNSERYYYYNQQTQECTWERPIEEEEGQEEEEGEGESSSVQRSNIQSNQNIYSSNHGSEIENNNSTSEEKSYYSHEDTQLYYYSSTLPSIEEEEGGEEEEEEGQKREGKETESPSNQSTKSQYQSQSQVQSTLLKSSFASAALRHIQRTTIQKDFHLNPDNNPHNDDNKTGELIMNGEETIDASAALALADAILLKRNIQSTDHLEVSQTSHDQFADNKRQQEIEKVMAMY